MSFKSTIANALGIETAESFKAALASKRKAEHEETQKRGAVAFAAYYNDGAWVKAKLESGMLFTPEMVAYLEREVENRKIAAEFKAEATKDITDEQKIRAAHLAEAAAQAETVPNAGSQHSGDSARDGSGAASGVQT